jgi:serine/threonine protein kinase
VVIDGSGRAKLCDFGLACIKTASLSSSQFRKKSESVDSVAGSLRWAAPETLQVVRARHAIGSDPALETH